MKPWMRGAAMTVVIAALLAGCSPEGAADGQAAGASGTSGGNGDVTEVTITATDYQFDITEIRVKQGDTVKINLKNRKGYHSIRFEGVKKTVQGNRSISFVAGEKGEFSFHCAVVCGSGHKKMVGKLIVE